MDAWRPAAWTSAIPNDLESPLMPDLSEVDAARPGVEFDYERELRACARGERAALENLYRRESSRLLGVALRVLRDRQLAEDVLHDAFVNIWRHAEQFDAQRGSARGWIYSITRNLALNAVRNGRREVPLEEESAETGDAPDDAGYQGPQDVFELKASMGRLTDCLSRLEPARRNCILYAYLEGCSHGEIAQRLKTPLGTVKAWIRRGMAALKECMA